MPNCEVKLMNDDGTTEVAQGQRGEMWVRTPSLMKGYWRRPDATRETVTTDGWMRTGDIAFQDEHGKFCIVDRKKASSLATEWLHVYADLLQELIKVKGNQVAPAELEALLLDHPHVQDAAVIGIKACDLNDP
jgi:4-coumarate--CoA ligase